MIRLDKSERLQTRDFAPLKNGSIRICLKAYLLRNKPATMSSLARVKPPPWVDNTRYLTPWGTGSPQLVGFWL